MKQPIRYFAIGLFTASIILLILFVFIEQPNKLEDENIDEMIEAIEADGYRVITETEYISLSVSKDNLEEEDTDDEDTNENDESENNKDEETNENNNEENEEENDEEENEDEVIEEEEKEEVVKYTLVIEANMPSAKVTELLVENNIIDDAAKFNVFLDDGGYSQLIQLGKHKLTSDMSYKEVAENLITFY